MIIKSKSISKREIATIREIQRYFPKLSREKVEIIDRNIKTSIANDDSYENIKLYVQRELKGQKAKKKYSFWVACAAIADEYDNNSKKWMSQENLFCFFALHTTIISLLWTLAEKVTGNEKWTSDFRQFVLYGLSFVIFKFLECKVWVYKSERFNRFLEMLNRYAPLLIMLSTMLFYGCSMLIGETTVGHWIMGGFAVLPVVAIIKTLLQMPPSDK